MKSNWPRSVMPIHLITRMLIVGLATFGCERKMREPIKESDVAGEWECVFQSVGPNLAGVTVTLALKPDHSFSEKARIASTGEIHQADGKWQYDPKSRQLALDGALSYNDYRGWSRDDATWFVKSDRTDGGPIKLRGGIIPDPDSFALFARK